MAIQLSRKWRERLNRWRESASYHLGRPYHFVAGIFTGIGQFFSRAWGTRNLRYMLQGVPAVLAIVLVGVLGALVRGQDRAAMAKTYLREAAKANLNDDFDTARICLEKALQLEPDNLETQYFLGGILERKATADKAPPEHAFAVMRKLAPDTSTGFAPAHVWMGNFMARSGNVAGAESHYTRAYQAAKAPSAADSAKAALPEAAQKLALIFFFLQNYEESRKYTLEAIGVLDPRKANILRLQILPELYRRTNRPDDATRELETAVRYFARQVEADVNDKECRIGLALGLRQLDRYPEAVEVMTRGAVMTKDQRFLQDAAELYAQWEIYLSKKPDSPLQQRLELIQEGLRLNPMSQTLIARLVQLSRAKGEQGEKAKQALQDMVAAGKSAFIVHYLLAMNYHNEGKEAEARHHWEQAYQIAGKDSLDPNLLVVMNNLAWLIAHDKKPDLERAFELSDFVNKKVPGVPRFQGTRGWILMKMGKFKEALPDLQAALRQSADDLEIQEALAESYMGLGNPAAAEPHRRKAEELRNKAKALAPGSALEKPVSTTPAPSPPAAGDAPKPKDG